MTNITMPSGEEHARNIAMLSRQLQLPEADVGAVYRQTLDGLVSHARIGTFISILAMRITRAALRQLPAPDADLVH